MGYTTNFFGKFNLHKSMSPEHKAYLNKFASVRHMKRNVSLANKLPDPERLAVDLPIGKDAEFFVGGLGFAGQDRDDSIIEYNVPADPQPGLWCQWEVTEDGNAIQWNGAEKFYRYTEWLQYLMDNFLTRWGYTLSGRVRYQGEDSGDVGVVTIEGGIARRIDLSTML